jgi:surface antigen
MKRIPVRFIVLAFTCLCAAIAVLFFYNHRCVGRVLDSYRGIPVYDNGLLFFRSYGKNYSKDGYYFGQKWQCVEYIKRFYYEIKGHKMPDVMGNAKSFFDEDLSDGAFNPRRALVQYRNGSTNMPCADDLMVFTDTRYGHVVIVTEVSGTSLEVIQQNILSGTRRRFSLVASNGHYFVTAPRQPAGWLRQKAR